MSMPWPVRAVLAFVPILITMSLLGVATQTSAQSPPWLTGQLLIASPDMGDPRFERTVLVMVRHDREGAFGLVINRPIREEPLAALLDLLGEKDTTATGQVRIHYGVRCNPNWGSSSTRPTTAMPRRAKSTDVSP